MDHEQPGADQREQQVSAVLIGMIVALSPVVVLAIILAVRS